MLKTETNTPNMHKRVLAAARIALGAAKYQADFEHGQWWLTKVRTGAQWSVCDAEGGDAVNGFCFEQISDGSED